MYLGYGGAFFGEGNQPAINNEAGVKTLETMKALTDYMDPEYLTSDSTTSRSSSSRARSRWRICGPRAPAPWTTRPNSRSPARSRSAAAPRAVPGGKPATTIWWDGIMIAKNISDEEADAAFKLVMEGLEGRHGEGANNDAAVWLVKGYQPGRWPPAPSLQPRPARRPTRPLPRWACCTTPSATTSPTILTGKKTAEQTLAGIEAATRPPRRRRAGQVVR